METPDAPRCGRGGEGGRKEMASSEKNPMASDTPVLRAATGLRRHGRLEREAPVSISRRSYGFGLLIVILGVVWLFNNLGVTAIDLGELVRVYWPVVLLAWGLDLIWRSAGWTGERVTGVVVLAVGAALLGRNLGWFTFDFSVVWRIFWPLVVIALGLLLISGPARTGNIHWGVMSGLEEKSPGWKLATGSYIACMGSVELDLTRATIPPGQTVLDLTAFMGGVELRVPRDLPIEFDGTAIFGGVEMLRNEAGGILAHKRWVHTPEGAGANPGRLLAIRARSIFGSVEVKEG